MNVNTPSDDPLHKYNAGAFLRDTTIPVPLASTRFRITVQDGVAKVETRRVFRNADHRPIEVWLTMPMPVRAVLYGIEIEHDGRTMRAECQPKGRAVERYEDEGVSGGRLAILHEELLPGIHRVQVANIAPGTEVSVTSTWATFLVPSTDGRAGFRLPLTVGEIYGRSPLADADDLVSDGAVAWGHLSVEGDDVVALSGGRRVAPPVDVPLDRPLDFSVPLRPWAGLSGTAHDGRRISLSLKPEPARETIIDAAVLIDRSGSMSNDCTFARTGLSRFEAVRTGLADAARRLVRGDGLTLFAFDDRCERLGRVSNHASCAAALAAAGATRGGTETGRALQAVLAETTVRDIVLITDGESHAIDVAPLLRSGRRFTVVLIGDDSLEARVGELAAGSGGALFVAHGAAVAEAVTAALAAVRSPHTIEPVLEGPLRSLSARRDGLLIEARWEEGDAPTGPLSDAVRALATALALPRLSEERAVALATEEALVGPLTSLVFVDQASARQEGLPVTYKVSLPAPAAEKRSRSAAPPTTHHAIAAPCIMPDPPAPAAAAPQPRALEGEALARALAKRTLLSRLTSGTWFEWPAVDEDVWNRHGTDLARGDLDHLPPALAETIRRFAADPDVVRSAESLGLAPDLAAIAILAWHTGSTWANRVANVICNGAAKAMLTGIVEEFVAREFPLSRRRNG